MALEVNKKMNDYEKRIEKSQLFFLINELYNNGKYKTFIKKASKFLELYPNDFQVYYLRGKALKELGCYEEAILDFEFAYKNGDRINAMIELFYSYYFIRKYDKAMELLPLIEKNNLINEKKLKVIKLVLKNKLNKMTLKDKFDIRDYVELQIVDYNLNNTLNHMRVHVYIDDMEKSKFRKDIDLKYLVEILMENIDDSNRSKIDSSLDVYYFGISGIGMDRNGDLANYVRVVVVHDTRNIVTAYPVSEVNDNIKNVTYDRNKLFKEEHEKTKVLSQIEKFNKKYNKSIK